MESMINSLTEMGFSELKCKMALCETDYRGLEAAMEWLLAHADDPEPDPEEIEKMETASEETKAKAPLTAEEKAAKLAELEALRVQKRHEREEREKAEELEREKRRVTEGKALNELRKDLEDREMKKIAEERRREKRETQMAKERVKAQIEADKLARKEADAARMAAITGKPLPGPAASATISPSAATPAAPKKNYDETRLQIRMPDGSALTNKFKVKEPLSAVRLYVQLNRKDPGSTPETPVKLMTNFPKKVFDEDDYDKPLDALSLVPSAALIVQK